MCRAIVTNIGPCPPTCQGEGEFVIATYRTVHRVPTLNVLLAGGESIRGTIDHRLWSHRDQQWKQLEELEPGETVQTRFGPLPAISSRLEKARQRVYNLEVRGQHVYEISRSGVLVHNNGDAHEEIIRQLAKNGKKNADDAVEHAPKGTKGVAIVDPKGKLGEFDEVLGDLFIEDKAGAIAGIKKGMTFTGKTLDQAASDWALKNILKKTKVRIQNLPKATGTIAEEGGSRIVPHLDDIKNIRKLHFRIEGNDPVLIRHVNDQISELRRLFPDWKFSVEFGT